MFGLSFGELVVVMIVAVVVIGPRELPRMLRKLGHWSGRLRRMAADLRAQSGIDDVLNAEGIAEDIHEIRKLARGQIHDAMTLGRVERTALDSPPGAAPSPSFLREHPIEGPDNYGALSDTANVYIDSLPSAENTEDLVLPADPLLGGNSSGAPQDRE